MAYNQADLLALLERLFPPHYVLPLQDPGPGWEIAQALAKQGERVSIALGRVGEGSYILTAPGGAKATVSVRLYRGALGGGAVVVKRGSVAKCSATGLRFLLDQDVTFGAGDFTGAPNPATMTAQEEGYPWNVLGPVTTADGTVLPGEIDGWDKLYEEPVYGDPTIQVLQLATATGGQAAFLDALGFDRGLARAPGESDTIYRARCRELPDVVSPAALFRAVVRVFAPYGAVASIVEPWDIAYQTCYDGPDSAVGDYDPHLFCYDDPRPAYPPFRNRWLSDDDCHAAFVAVVPNLAAIADVGMAYDDTAMTPAAHVSPTTGGRRAHSAWDVPSTASAALILQGGYDGFDLLKQAVYLGLWDSLAAIKAAGVLAAIELQGE